MTVRVLLADDQKLLRGALRMMIDAVPDLEVVGEAATGREAVSRARSTRAEVIVMDLRMPDLDGIAATRLVTADDDLAGTRVLVLTTFETDELVLDALRAGASGFLGKSATPEQLLDAIRMVAAGDALLSPLATRAVIEQVASQTSLVPPDDSALATLTTREREIVALVAGGLSNTDIAERLSISPATAKTHVNRAMMKAGARDRAQLVILAYESGLVIPGRAGADPQG